MRRTIIVLMTVCLLFAINVHAKDKTNYYLSGTDIALCNGVGEDFYIKIDLIGKILIDGKNIINITETKIVDFGNDTIKYLIVYGDANTYIEDSLIVCNYAIAYPLTSVKSDADFSKEQEKPPVTHTCKSASGLLIGCSCCEFRTNNNGEINGCKCCEFGWCEHSVTTTVSSPSDKSENVVTSLTKYFLL
ncbi:MAG: hypothetical protein LBP67_07090 [Bacteroidales bacterium]|jgi:hypothetical protein|nr:hypothetical protein [Bacteroidales bacterium]